MRKSAGALCVAVGLIAAACSIEQSGYRETASAPRAMRPKAGPREVPPGSPTPVPIDLTDGLTAVYGESPVTVWDSRTVRPQIQVAEPWRGPIRGVEEELEARNPNHEKGEEALRNRQRRGPENDLAAGEVLGEERGRVGPLFPGIGQTPWHPPDCTIAVGRNYIVETVNMVVAWYTRTGTLVFSQNLDSTGDPGFFESVGGGTFCFDPKCFYDHIDNRYVIVALETYGSTQAWIDIAVSDDDDPNGVWYKYRTNAVVSVGTDTFWVDYPGVGYDKDAYYINGNLFGLGANNQSGWAGVLFRVFKKLPLLGGGAAQFNDLRDAFAGSVQGSTHYGANQAAYFISTETTSQMRVNAIRNPLTVPTMTFTLVSVPAFAYSPGGAPTPPGNGETIDTIDDRPFNSVWREGDLYFAHNSYGSGKNLARWYHLKTNSWPQSGVVTSVEAGNVNAGGSLHSFFPALGVDRCKNVGMVLGTSSGTQNPQVRVTGRINTDPAGTMGATQVVQTGPSSVNGRWGDYFGVALDPTDGYTFWYVGEYQDSSGWRTYIGSFRLGCHADYDCNGFVNGDDYDLFADDFIFGNQAADYDGNGFVNGDDWDFFNYDFEAGC